MRVRYLARNSVNNNQPWLHRECETTKQLKYAALRRFRWTNYMYIHLLEFQQFVALQRRYTIKELQALWYFLIFAF
jgi:hypothetical protein